jgi:hypothetical protein
MADEKLGGLDSPELRRLYQGVPAIQPEQFSIFYMSVLGQRVCVHTAATSLAFKVQMQAV